MYFCVLHTYIGIRTLRYTKHSCVYKVGFFSIFVGVSHIQHLDGRSCEAGDVRGSSESDKGRKIT